MSEDDDTHVTRREMGMILDTLHQELKTLESRLTVKLLLVVVAGSAVGKAISPTVAAVVTAVGVTGWFLKALILGFLHRG